MQYYTVGQKTFLPLLSPSRKKKSNTARKFFIPFPLIKNTLITNKLQKKHFWNDFFKKPTRNQSRYKM